MPEHKSPSKTYHGFIVPLITPLTPQGELDEPALRRTIDYVVNGGANGIFMLGTTGEGPSAPREIRARAVRQALEYTNGRAQVFAGIPSTVVDENIDAAKDYLRHGAAAVVAPLPGYYPLTPAQQFRYYATLAERVRGAVILYDTPISPHGMIDPGVIEHLRVFSNVVGIKDSSGDRDRLHELLNSYSDDPGFAILVGKSGMVNYGLQRGADGFVSLLGNLNPSLCSRMYASAQKGDWALMEDLQREIDAGEAEIGGETIGQTIARLKRKMQERGLCGVKVLLPLQEEE